jgi:rhodanese-related sulfurtransferase
VRRFPLKEILLLLALAFVPAIGEVLYFRDRVPWESPLPASMRATVAQAKGWGTNALWIDARSDDEFAREHIPDALLLNEDHFNEQLPTVLAAWSPGKRMVVYCSTKSCGASRAIAKRLHDEADIEDVFVLEGGWEAWQAAGK